MSREPSTALRELARHLDDLPPDAVLTAESLARLADAVAERMELLEHEDYL